MSVATVNKTTDVEQPLDFTLPLPVGQRLTNAPSITPNCDDDEHANRDLWVANVPQMANVNQGEQCKCQKYEIEVPPLPMMATPSLERLRIDFFIDCHVVDHGNHLTTDCVSVATANRTNDVEQPLDFTLPLPVGQRKKVTPLYFYAVLASHFYLPQERKQPVVIIRPCSDNGKVNATYNWRVHTEIGFWSRVAGLYVKRTALVRMNLQQFQEITQF